MPNTLTQHLRAAHSRLQRTLRARLIPRLPLLLCASLAASCGSTTGPGQTTPDNPYSAIALPLRASQPEMPARFFAVGDPHQVIYAWRGSSPQLFDVIEQRLGCVRYELPVNYRSTGEILEGARAVLGWQGEHSALHSERGGGQKIVVRRHHHGHMEGLYLAQRLRDLQLGGTPLREMAVLFRTRRQAQAMHDVLARAGVACVEPTRASVDERPAVAWLLAVLRLALGTADVDAARTLLTHPQFGVLANRQWNPRTFTAFAQKHGQEDLPTARLVWTNRRAPTAMSCCAIWTAA